MKRLIYLVVFVLFLCFTAEADTLTVQPSTIDSFIDQGTPTTNYGDVVSIIVESHSSSNSRTLVKFDFSSLDDTAVISDATLSLYFWATPDGDPYGRTYWAYRLTQTGWTEGAGGSNNVTWNNYTTATAWTTAGGDYTTTDGASSTVPGAEGVWMSWDVTNQVKTAQSSVGEVYHALVKDGTENNASLLSAYFYSKQGTPGDTTKRPKLVITYTLPASFVPKVMIIQ